MLQYVSLILTSKESKYSFLRVTLSNQNQVLSIFSRIETGNNVPQGSTTAYSLRPQWTAQRNSKPYNECKRSVSLLRKPNVKIKRVNICKTPLTTGLVRGQSADSLLWKHWFVVVPLLPVTKLYSVHITRLPVDYGSILSSCVSQAWIPVVWFLPVACWSVPEDRCFDFQAPQKPKIKMIISLLTKDNDKRLNKKA